MQCLMPYSIKSEYTCVFIVPHLKVYLPLEINIIGELILLPGKKYISVHMSNTEGFSKNKNP